jgi:hypothetical protein
VLIRQVALSSRRTRSNCYIEPTRERPGWGKVTGSSTDSAFVANGAIAWLKVTVVGAQDGPTGGDKLTATTLKIEGILTCPLSQ